MGGSEAKPISNQEHHVLLQYSSHCNWESIERVVKLLRQCLPNAVISSYRCNSEMVGLEVYAAVDKAAAKIKVYQVGELK